MYEDDEDSDLNRSQYSDYYLQSSRKKSLDKFEKYQQMLSFYDSQPYLSLETQVITSQIVDLLFRKGANNLYEKYLITKMPDFQAKKVNGLMSALIQQGMMYGDKGESQEELKTFWKEEKEPQVLNYDSRSIYAVNVDFKQIIIDETELDDSDAKSIISNSSRFSFASRKTNKLLSASQKIMTLSKINQNMVESIVKQKKPEKYQPELVRMPDEASPEPDPIADRLRLAREKKDYVKALELEKQRKQIQDELDFENKKKEAQRLLKHKQFTHDYNGNIIYLKKDRDQVPIPNNIINLDAKSKQPSEIVKEAILPNEDGKKVKQMNFRSQQKPNFLETLEFHNQPLLHLTLKPNPGNKVMTMQGQIMEGGFLSIQNRMRKGEYDKMIESLPNRPVANYLGGTQTQFNQQMMDEIMQKDGIHHHRLSLHSSSQMRIINKDALEDMLEDKKKRKSNASQDNINEDSLDQLRKQLIVKEKEKQEKERKKKEIQKQIKLEKITIYPSIEKTVENGEYAIQTALTSPKTNQKKEPTTRLHLEVEKFDLQNIKDPTWGDPNLAKSQMLMISSENQKRGKEPVTFKIRRQQKLVNSNKQMKMTASKFFNS
ncbi:hypothetical protein ABPG72_016777 [Tetrahymena utriculariae]